LNNIIKQNATLSLITRCTPKEERKEDEVQISISIANKGEIALKRIRLNASLPNGTIYKDSSYLNPEKDGILKYPTRIENDYGTTDNLSWFIGDIPTGQAKDLTLLVSSSNAKDFDCSKVKVHATGHVVGERIDVDGS
jgi:hypothetical protein